MAPRVPLLTAWPGILSWVLGLTLCAQTSLGSSLGSREAGDVPSGLSAV